MLLVTKEGIKLTKIMNVDGKREKKKSIFEMKKAREGTYSHKQLGGGELTKYLRGSFSGV